MTAPDINETLRQHRNDLAQKIHEQCDTIELAVVDRGRASAAKDAIDQIHALADLLADIVIAPDLDDMARRLDQHAVELAENNEYDYARSVIETAEVFSRRHAQLTSATTAVTPTDRYHLSGSFDPSAREAFARHQRRASQAGTDVARRRW